MKPSERKKARHYIVQALYQWQMAKPSLSELEEQFLEDNDFSKTDVEYFKKILQGVTTDTQSLDLQFDSYLDRPLKDLGCTELAILRLGTFELMHCIDVPYKVVINESVDLAKKFAATDAHKYINGVLDKVARKLRKTEMKR